MYNNIVRNVLSYRSYTTHSRNCSSKICLIKKRLFLHIANLQMHERLQLL